jgi:hypothetical protein
MKTTVIYHSADFDGIFCREIARKFLPDAELIGWNYGEPLIAMPAEGMVCILDLSPECLAVTGPVDVPFWDRIIWIDHHKSAIEKWSTAIPGYRIDGVAACRLTWQWFEKECHDYPLNAGPDNCQLPTKQEFVDRKVVEPDAVRLAGEYDIWDKRDPDAELFQHGLRSCDLSGYWPNLLRDDEETVAMLLERGEGIQYVRTKENESVITRLGFTLQWEGLTFLACNHATFNSHLFTAGLKPEHDACFGFKWNGKTSQWDVSLYHAPGKEHHDLSLLAAKHGGGGHRGACGFRAKSLPFLEQLPVKMP